MKNKTVATWLAFLGGPLGLHRFYLHGWTDTLGWALPIPTALGIYGIERVQQYGLDDQLSWVLIPLLGFTLAASALTAIFYGLMPVEKWNARFNPEADADADADAELGGTNWLTMLAVIASLLVGAISMMGSMAYSFQHYFEYQVEEARKISQ